MRYTNYINWKLYAVQYYCYFNVWLLLAWAAVYISKLHAIIGYR